MSFRDGSLLDALPSDGGQVLDAAREIDASPGLDAVVSAI